MTKSVARPVVPRSVPELLCDWTQAGLITDEQAEAIRQREARADGRQVASASGPSLVVEALGYLGGVVMLVGATILVTVFWHDISTPVRLVLIGGTTAVLIGAGFAVPGRLGDAAGRLRSVLWAAGVVTTGGFFAVLALDVLHRHDYHAMVVIGPAAAVVAVVLWRLRTTWLQQFALFVSLMISVDGLGLELTSSNSSWGGALMWGTGVGWAALSLARWIEPRLTGVAFGVLGGVLGALIMDNGVGIALGLLTAAATVGLALWAHNLPWLGVSAITLLATAPRAANEWFPGPLSAALTFMIAGGILVSAAVWVTRHQGT